MRRWFLAVLTGWLLLEVMTNPGLHREWRMVFGPARQVNRLEVISAIEIFEDESGALHVDPVSSLGMAPLAIGTFDCVVWRERNLASVEETREYSWQLVPLGAMTPPPGKMMQAEVAASEYFSRQLHTEKYRIFTAVKAAGGPVLQSRVLWEVWGSVAPVWAVALGAFVWVCLATSEVMEWRSRRRRRNGRCGRCGYDLTGVAGGCPECGEGMELAASE